MEFKKSIWQIGKEDNRKFLQIKLTRKHNLASFMIGILVAAIIMLPFACLVFECIEIVWPLRCFATSSLYSLMHVARVEIKSIVLISYFLLIRASS